MLPFQDITQTVSTPEIRFDAARSCLCIAGESYPENSFDFYAPMLRWVKEVLTALAEFHLDVNVSYLNSSSTKCMLDLLDLLEEAHKKGTAVTVTWQYDRENPRSLDLAEEFKEEVTFPFAVVALNE
ncbi:DUF1987 domain-containing protein [Geomesophilobacter sediminis]|uniref:DUF1987 domain-containing protein n=1 Tax=Geomesophilobacter sediminis TaxID=2798584 RepID=A0A8J7LWZ3_9BACT|nr:DUF1987 domain-containing protein [Geomesophilobacter sediminis]MBJ6726445.1 DUF1987 domain-containing protein [Geomesophilobacter sediminis]